jgi:hypothetical protein
MTSVILDLFQVNILLLVTSKIAMTKLVLLGDFFYGTGALEKIWQRREEIAT